MASSERQLEQLTAYLDGELSDAERAKVEAWLEKDEQARALLDELQQTATLVSGLPRMQAPGQMADDVAQRIERAALLGEESAPLEIRTRQGSGWRRGLAMAASIVLLVTAGWYVWPGSPMVGHDEADVTTLAEAPELDKTNGMKSAIGAREGAPADTLVEADEETAPVVAEAEASDDAAVAMITREAEDTGRRAGRGIRMAARDEARRSIADRNLPTGPPAPAEKGHAALAVEEKEAPPLPPRFADDVHGGGRGVPVNAVVTNAGIRSLNTTNVSNVLVVETNQETQKEIVAYLNRFVADNSIPNARDNTFAEPIPSTQKYYLDEGNTLAEKSRDRETAPARNTDEVRLVLNAPAEEVEDLLTNVNRIRSMNRAPMNWTANSLTLDRNDVAVAMALLKTDPAQSAGHETLLGFDEDAHATLPEKDEPPLGDDEASEGTRTKGKKATGTHGKPAAEKAETGSPSPPGKEKGASQQDEQSQEKVKDDRAVKSPPRVAKAERRRGRRFRAGERHAVPSARRASERDREEQTFAAPPPSDTSNSQFIQIAMIFRTLSDASITGVADTQPDKPARSHAGRARSRTTSQPTSQGAPRG